MEGWVVRLMDGERVRQMMDCELAGWLASWICGAQSLPSTKGFFFPFSLLMHSVPLLRADDERMLVEPACGAPLAVIYSGHLGRLQAEGHLRPSLASVVVIVCGGNNIDSGALQALKAQVGQS